jgi:hypothetical protein
MAIATIGGEAITVALPNFKTLKAAWPYIAAMQDAGPMDGIDAILGVIAVGATDRDLTVEALEEKLTPAELPGLRPFMNALMVEAGLAGEPTPAEADPPETPSPETSTPSSPNSSPQDAATGM